MSSFKDDVRDAFRICVEQGKRIDQLVAEKEALKKRLRYHECGCGPDCDACTNWDICSLPIRKSARGGMVDVDKVHLAAAVDDSHEEMGGEARQVRRAAVGCARIVWTVLPLMRVVSRECGYALAVHGSMIRDVDVVAIPWTEEACSAEALVKRLWELLGEGGFGPFDQAAIPSEPKPHGRAAYTLLTFSGGFIDLSVMPRTEKKI
jgi:hypothetical protein